MVNNKHFNTYVLFFSILIFSSIIFLYDEEKIVVLCLISFVTILYYNFSQIIFNALNDQSVYLKKELVNLFEEKIIIMRKLRYTWRIFLDIEDLIIDMYCWIKQKFFFIIKKKNARRINIFWKLIIRKDLNDLLKFKLLVNENLKILILNLLKKKLMYSKTLNLNSLNLLKNLSKSKIQFPLILNKLKINALTTNSKINYNTYYYLKWFL